MAVLSARRAAFKRGTPEPSASLCSPASDCRFPDMSPPACAASQLVQLALITTRAILFRNESDPYSEHMQRPLSLICVDGRGVY